MDLFRAIFRNTDSEDSSSSEEEEAANTMESASTSLKVEVDAATEQPRNDDKMDTGHIEEVSSQKGTCLS